MIGEFTVEILKKAGLNQIPGDAAEKFTAFYDMLIEANKKFNLTRIESETDAAWKHFYDSAAPLIHAASYIKEGAKVIDLGAGAGFPSIPLMILRRDLSFTMVDAVGKKVNFLNETCAALSLPGKALHARGEELAREPGFRDSFDLALARAVASYNTLIELTLPFVNVGGSFIAYKGPGIDEELVNSDRALSALGCEEKYIKSDYSLFDGAQSRTLIIARKIRPTPPNFPRTFAQIKKSPIGSK